MILETIAHNAGQMISEKQTLEVLQMEQKRGKLLMSLMNLFNEARDGALPLLNAMKRVVRLLLRAGASLSAANWTANNILHCAARNGATTVLKWLAEDGLRQEPAATATDCEGGHVEACGDKAHAIAEPA